MLSRIARQMCFLVVYPVIPTEIVNEGSFGGKHTNRSLDITAPIWCPESRKSGDEDYSCSV
jgi:hypothetical protein